MHTIADAHRRRWPRRQHRPRTQQACAAAYERVLPHGDQHTWAQSGGMRCHIVNLQGGTGAGGGI